MLHLGAKFIVRAVIHARPNASIPIVGGEDNDALVVRVVEPAEKERATAAALKAIADELAIPRRCVTLVSGATGRRKVTDIECESNDFARVAKRLVDFLSGKQRLAGEPGCRSRGDRPSD